MLANTGLSWATSPRVEELILKMHLSEKLTLMHGTLGVYTGNIPAIERLGIPAINMQDGPQGFRSTDKTGGEGSSTAWPSLLTFAASWDEDLLGRWASALAEEFVAKGANMHLGPGIGIARVPTAGRNFEYLCGEDPILGSVLVKPVIRNIQEKGLLADAKHYVNNEIENHRMLVSANVDEKTRFELYYPPFQAAVDAGVLTVMCAYNRINDVYACQNEETLSHLRDIMGFKGWVVSDWTATKSTVKSLHAGLDQEMPTGMFYNRFTLEKKLVSGEISLEEINGAVRRILSAMETVGILDRAPGGNPLANVTCDAHNSIAREAAAKSTVLLKNADGVLPLSANSLGDCIAVLGDSDTVAGGGSGHVNGPYVITPAQGIQNALSAAGVSSTKVIYNSGSDINAAAAVAKQCSVAVVVVATTSGEGSDRKTLALSGNQDKLVSAIASVNPRTIVAMNIPGAILMPWADEVDGILASWMPGQEAGNALADVLFGTVNPSARLPITMPNKDNEVDFQPDEYPGVGFPPKATYHEELLIGYRWYDAHNVTPRYPFGHGLSYTTFTYSQLLVAKLPVNAGVLPNNHVQTRTTPVISMNFRIANTGSVNGDEVAQVYLAYPSAANEPPRQLRAFQKVSIASGDNKKVSITLTKQDCAVWNASAHAWEILAGEYTVFVGSSSRDIRLQSTFVLN